MAIRFRVGALSAFVAIVVSAFVQRCRGDEFEDVDSRVLAELVDVQAAGARSVKRDQFLFPGGDAGTRSMVSVPLLALGDLGAMTTGGLSKPHAESFRLAQRTIAKPAERLTSDLENVRTLSLFAASACATHAASGDDEAKRLASEAIRLLLERQNDDGGWGVEQGKSDLLSTAFAVDALQRAHMNYLEIDRPSIERVQAFAKNAGPARTPLDRVALAFVKRQVVPGYRLSDEERTAILSADAEDAESVGIYRYLVASIFIHGPLPADVAKRYAKWRESFAARAKDRPKILSEGDSGPLDVQTLLWRLAIKRIESRPLTPPDHEEFPL